MAAGEFMARMSSIPRTSFPIFFRQGLAEHHEVLLRQHVLGFDPLEPCHCHFLSGLSLCHLMQSLDRNGRILHSVQGDDTFIQIVIPPSSSIGFERLRAEMYGAENNIIIRSTASTNKNKFAYIFQLNAAPSVHRIQKKNLAQNFQITLSSISEGV